jgi:hypothetical protein
MLSAISVKNILTVFEVRIKISVSSIIRTFPSKVSFLEDSAVAFKISVSSILLTFPSKVSFLEDNAVAFYARETFPKTSSNSTQVLIHTRDSCQIFFGRDWHYF